jgi:hypothetical protein
MTHGLFNALSLFAVVGPPCGYAGYVCHILATAQEVSSEMLLTIAATSLVAIPVSYVFGLLPALVTGFIAWGLRTTLGRWTGAVFCGFVGTGASLPVLFVLAGSALEIEPAFFIEALEFSGITGGTAGFICGLFHFTRKPEND